MIFLDLPILLTELKLR